MHVLFVSSARFNNFPYGDGSTRYRCFNVGEALVEKGHQFSVASIDTLSDEHLHYADVISVLRPRYSKKLARFVTAAKKRGIHTVVDFDDLIFHPVKAAESPLVVNGFSNVERVTQTFEKHAQAAALFDEVTVSTNALLGSAQEALPNLEAHLLRNGLSKLWLNQADQNIQAISSQELEPSSRQRITYLPGTLGHDEDFRQIQAVLLEWLAVNEQRTLCVVGNMNLDKHWTNHSQLERWPLVDYFSLPEWIRRSDVTIAPLVRNEFNNAKSHIKFLESAAFGVPTVCSPNSDLEDHTNPIGLYLASDPEQWRLALTQVAENFGHPEYSSSVKADIRERCHTRCYSTATIERWADRVEKRAQRVVEASSEHRIS